MSSRFDGQKPDETVRNQMNMNQKATPHPSTVIASEAKQSIGQHAAPWIASSQVLLAMTLMKSGSSCARFACNDG
jgi:hypothetical protein